MGIGERMRMAGEALADNALTRSWQGSADRYVTGPIGRRLASDELLREQIPKVFGALSGESGEVHPLQVELLNRVRGKEDLTAEALIQAREKTAPDGSMGSFLGSQLAAYMSDGAVDREFMLGAASDIARAYDGRQGLTQSGSNVRQFATGSPVAAYGAVLGGGALAVKGALDVVRRLQAGEPVSDEEVEAAGAVLSSANKTDGHIP